MERYLSSHSQLLTGYKILLDKQEWCDVAHLAHFQVSNHTVCIIHRPIEPNDHLTEPTEDLGLTDLLSDLKIDSKKCLQTGLYGCSLLMQCLTVCTGHSAISFLSALTKWWRNGMANPFYSSEQTDCESLPLP